MGIRPPWDEAHCNMATLTDETDAQYHNTIMEYQLHAKPEVWWNREVDVVPSQDK